MHDYNFPDYQSPKLFTKKELYLAAHEPNGKSHLNDAIPRKLRRKVMDDNMHLMDGMQFHDGYPKMMPYNGSTDFTLVSYVDRKKSDGKNQALHFFLDDWRFRNPVWYELERCTYSIAKFDYYFTPDLSLWRNLPTEFYNQKNIYRTRFIGAYWQICGYNVIPTASWGGLNSYSYCFKGLPHNSVVAVSGMGCCKDRQSFQRWCNGLQRLEKEVSPTIILVYGDEVDISDITTPVQFMPCFISTHLRNG